MPAPLSKQTTAVGLAPTTSAGHSLLEFYLYVKTYLLT